MSVEEPHISIYLLFFFRFIITTHEGYLSITVVFIALKSTV